MGNPFLSLPPSSLPRTRLQILRLGSLKSSLFPIYDPARFHDESVPFQSPSILPLISKSIFLSNSHPPPSSDSPSSPPHTSSLAPPIPNFQHHHLTLSLSLSRYPFPNLPLTGTSSPPLLLLPLFPAFLSFRSIPFLISHSLPQHEMDSWRVAVLGDGGVGKTALAVQVRSSSIDG